MSAKSKKEKVSNMRNEKTNKLPKAFREMLKSIKRI